MRVTIQHAITERHLVEFEYGGHHRIVEPHVLGRQGGQDQVLGYQVRGTSGSGPVPEWRRFRIDGMSGLRESTETFAGPRPTPVGPHSSWDQVYLIVA